MSEENLSQRWRWPVSAADSKVSVDPGAPTRAQLAASIGCDPSEILRSARNVHKHAPDGREIWTSFVDSGQDSDQVAVYETVWPQ